MDEFTLIYRYFSALGRGDAVDLGVGDDCALLRLNAGERLATSVDTMVEGVHFPANAFPEDIGFRAVAVAVSDLAAMGARPIGMTLALTLPEPDEFWLHSFSEGVSAAVSEFSIPLVGGDTTRGPLTITVQVLGALALDTALLRSGASPGDNVYVSGTLGDAAAGLAIIQDRLQPASAADGEYLLQRFYRPQPPLSLGLKLAATATAAIDISDGLLADAGHIAAASGVQIRLDCAAIPLSDALKSCPNQDTALDWALSGGDDYELCFCLAPAVEPPSGVTRIGEVIAGEGVSCDRQPADTTGYQHFGA